MSNHAYRPLNAQGGTALPPLKHRIVGLVRFDPKLTACLMLIIVSCVYLGLPSVGSLGSDDDGNSWIPSLRLPSWKPSDNGDSTGQIRSKGFLKIRMHDADMVSENITDEGSANTSSISNFLLERHPLLQLIEEAKIKHDELEEYKKRINTLEAAVQDYRQTFGLEPPEGFDQWFIHAQSHSLTAAPSLIPLAHTSILPYLSLPGPLLRSRALSLQKETGIFGMSFYPPKGGEKEHSGGWQDGEEKELDGMMGIRNEDFMTGYMSPRHDYPPLLAPLLPLLPPSPNADQPVQLSVCVRDGACRLSAGKLMEKSRKLAKEGKEWTKRDLVKEEIKWAGKRGWSATCPTVPSHSTSPETSPFSTTPYKSFIQDNNIAMDFCEYPQIMPLVGEMIMEDQHVMRGLAPVLAVSRPLHGADMLGVPTRAVNDLAKDSEIEWSEKTKRQVVWRGTATGVYHRDRWDWRSSQRHRLSRFVWNTTGEVEKVLIEEETESGAREVFVEEYSKKDLVQRWLDIGLVEEDINNICGPGPTGDSCHLDGSHAYPTCPERETACDEMISETHWVNRMSLEESEPYRYRLDVDGYGWSSRFRKLLSTNSVVLKSTVYPEWWTAQAIPYYHYIPISLDYSDLFDHLSFLDGTPEGSISTGRQDIAEMIAGQGRDFALKELSEEGMRSYMFLFLLEYRRAWSDNRTETSFQMNDSS